MPSARPVKRAAVVLHGRPEALGSGLARLEAVAQEKGVELVVVTGEAGVALDDVEVAIVLGGDGTVLRSLHRFLGTGVPVIGVNFGRVGFLSAIPKDELEQGVARVLAGEYEIVELATLEVEAGGKAIRGRERRRRHERRSWGAWSSSNGRSAPRTSAASRVTG